MKKILSFKYMIEVYKKMAIYPLPFFYVIFVISFQEPMRQGTKVINGHKY